MQIMPNVYQITTGRFNGVNAFLIAEEKLTLIDTGLRDSLAQIIDFIHHIGRSEEEISLIIITHNHPDHTGSLMSLKKIIPVRVAAHKADITFSPYHGFMDKIIQLFPRLRQNLYLDASLIDQPLSGGEVLPPLGGLEVINTPGHTPGSISLLSVKHKILFAGDLINNRYSRLRIPYRIINHDTNKVKESVRHIAELDFDIACVGHGKPLMKDGSVKVRQLAARLA
jgi:glyoxylase-like metal-dependent hydrolase (beta-lactamase superfamily II)